VRVDLIVRGISCLRPGVPGVSENIRVRSIVGRFLEHHRIFCFHARGEGKTLLFSADWMERNLHRRVETCFPVNDPKLKAAVLNDGLETYLQDDCQAWLLDASGAYERATSSRDEPLAAQEVLRERLGDLGGRKREPGGKKRGRFRLEVG